MMTSTITLPWIEAGYQCFAQEGPNGLKVEVLARIVGKSKSSFYHHFADLEVFTEFLLAYHYERALLMAERERACQTVDPELIQVILDFGQDLLFHRQLRIHRTQPQFEGCIEKVDTAVLDAFIEVWARELGLSEHQSLAEKMYGFTLDNFYLQLSEQTLNHDWLAQYFQEIRKLVQSMKESQ